MNADEQVVDGFGERPLNAKRDIVWTRCEVCDEQVTTHKAVAIPAGYICGQCFTPRGQFLG